MKIGFFGFLGIIFITLKLFGVISWSWWLVTSPLWAPWAIFILFVIIVEAFGIRK